MKGFPTYAREAGPVGVALLALATALCALILAWAVANPVQETADHIVAPVARSVGVLASPADVQCLEGWTGTAGKDPDGKIKLKVCTSPDKRFIITVRENQAPAGYDGVEKRFLEPEEIASKLR